MDWTAAGVGVVGVDWDCSSSRRTACLSALPTFLADSAIILAFWNSGSGRFETKMPRPETRPET
eukprot:scaffold14342_cov209-Ochromonas_danica.AAC.3